MSEEKCSPPIPLSNSCNIILALVLIAIQDKKTFLVQICKIFHLVTQIA
jgi:hypothetical protein